MSMKFLPWEVSLSVFGLPDYNLTTDGILINKISGISNEYEFSKQRSV